MLENIIKNNVAVIIDFWSPSCGPCINFAPHYEEFSKSFGNKVKFLKINTQECREIGNL
jgi:thioredoxin 2